MSKKLEFINIENKDFINQYFYRYKILENEFENFKNILINYIKDMNKRENENEDSLVANCLSPFFKKLDFEPHVKYKMKGKSEIDLAILKDSDIQVIIEAKKPNDKDFFYAENPNCKALHEAILYYFRIREESNSSIKYIILTDFYKFYIFEAKEFENGFYKNKDFEKLYKSFTNKNSIFDGRTEEFYLEAKKILDLKNFALKGAFIDLNEIIKTDAEYDFKSLKPYFKIFNRDFLLQEFNPNDANQLNKGFYDELLYLLGLCEKVINGKTLIAPSKNSIDKEGTLYYNILQHLPEYKRDKKENSENEIDENALEILIIWINRILFLKLLESSLINFNDDKNLAFLNIDKIQNYNKLNELFFKILAKKPNDNDRKQNNIKDLAYLPYLNSSLFTRSNKEIIEISQLSNLQLEYFKNTQIKDKSGKAKKGKEDWLKMIFEFLNSFDFGANYDNENLLAQKDLINSSVLGLVFEKLNGYKEGSFYTPSFITSYMCKESLDRIVLQKFSENGLNAENLDILQKQILVNVNADFNFRDKAINILEEIRICDPAVGSGHFLVSALNEMIYIYYKLGLINISVSDLKIENDEILIKDREGGNFEYKRPKSQNDNHKIQMEIFNLKKSIIENNLFGVDINSNSCEITKLRLWIELLKNSYYLSFDSENYHNLQTLPNIDINIKCGNSLISNIDFGISKDNFLSNLKSRIDKADMFERETLKKEFDDIKKEIPQRFENAKVQAKIYKNANDKTEAKKSKDIYEESILYLIKLFKRTCNEYINFYQGLHDFFYNYGYININNISNEQIKSKLKNYIEYFKFHEFVSFEKKIIREVKEKELSKIKTLMQAYEDFENKKTFEWRFEFPEVLDYEGNFKGFDLIIGNPPYGVDLSKEEREYYKIIYKINSTNTAQLFIVRAYMILGKNGVNSFIVPKSLCYIPKWKPLRDLLKPNLYLLTDCGKAWDYVLLEMIIYLIHKNNKCNTYKNIFLQENNKTQSVTIDKKLIDLFGLFINDLSKEEIKLGYKIKNNCPKNLLNFAECFRGDSFQKFIKDDLKGFKVLGGKEIQRYSIKGIKGYITQDKIGENSAIKNNSILLQRIIAHIENPIPHIKFTGTITNNKKYKIVNTIFQIICNKDISNKFILGLFHSKLINWYCYRFAYSKAIRSMDFSNEIASKMPIPEINSKNKEIADKIINNVDDILKIKNKNSNADISIIEREIDILVYELYNLENKEIEAIEK